MKYLALLIGYLLTLYGAFLGGATFVMNKYHAEMDAAFKHPTSIEDVMRSRKLDREQADIYLHDSEVKAFNEATNYGEPV